MRKMPPKHLQMIQKLGLSYFGPGGDHNALPCPTFLYYYPLHSIFDHIIIAIYGMSSGNVKSCKKSCGFIDAGIFDFSLPPVVAWRARGYHTW